jgi:hypothetical protein
MSGPGGAMGGSSGNDGLSRAYPLQENKVFCALFYKKAPLAFK